MRNANAIKWSLAIAVAAATFSLDLLSKRIVQARDFDPYEVLPFLTIARASNRGVAFGLFAGQRAMILAAAGLALTVIIAYIILEKRPVLAGIAGGLLLGGSLGNLQERVIHGRVTDFLKLPYWPTLNLADVFIVLGVVLVAVSLLFAWESSTPGGEP